MHATAIAPVRHHRRPALHARAAAPAPFAAMRVAVGGGDVAQGVAQLGMRRARVGVGVQVGASSWLWPVGGAVAGFFIAGLPGALAGGALGWFLTRR